ncbi:hypothetical protein BLM15_07715 [Bosea sp. Tri-49]|nr:hypothetical protein BLM15_07715 [Bosea sp. Tri-49]
MQNLAEILSRIDQRLAALGLTDNAASKKAGKPDAIRNARRALSAPNRQGIAMATLEALAGALDTTLAWLVDGTGQEAPSPAADAGPRIPLTPHPQKGGRPDLAVRGIALGGKEGDGDFQLNGDALQYLERPAGLLNRPKAFAVILKNTSMEPVYKHGWPIFVDPDGRKPVDGEDVLIELHGESEHEPGPAFIKTLVGRRSGHVLLSQYNPPPETLQFEAPRVKQILRVIPYPEAMGLSV